MFTEITPFSITAFVGGVCISAEIIIVFIVVVMILVIVSVESIIYIVICSEAVVAHVAQSVKGDYLSTAAWIVVSLFDLVVLQLV